MANLSQVKRNRMIEFLNRLKEEHRDDDDVLKSIYEIENEMASKKYGLVWEEHEENVDIQMRTNIPVFKEVKEKEIVKTNDKANYNFLLEGDNLHSLKLLEKTHKGKIDVIYIDPPYNRGENDFIYDDDYVDKEDAFKHSKWLSFMAKRLDIAKELLSNDGLLFISIDDNEQSQLKLLVDDILSDFNFVVCLPRQTKKSGKTTGSFSKNHDYVLVYIRKNTDIFVMPEYTDKKFDNEDEFVKERGKYRLNQTLDYDSLQYSQSLDYPIEIEGTTFYPGGDYEKYLERKDGSYKRADWAWRWKPDRFEFGYNNGFVVVKTKSDGTSRIYTKTYLNAEISQDKETGQYIVKYKKRTKPISSIEFTENKYSNDMAKKDLKIFGLEDMFDYSKPVELIKALIKCHYNKDAIVLDFFAGSGTTGQSVMELNDEDGGNRKFILCTNNENNICEEVTYSRISKLLKGFDYTGRKKTIIYEKKFNQSDLKKMDERWKEIDTIKENNESKFDRISTSFSGGIYTITGIKEYDDRFKGYDINLKYYKTKFIPKQQEDEEQSISDNLLEYIEEMVQLENGIDIDNINYCIILTDKDADKIEKEWEKYKDCKTFYISKNVLLTTSQNRLLSSVEIKTIPDYYFATELREVGELW